MQVKTVPFLQARSFLVKRAGAGSGSLRKQLIALNFATLKSASFVEFFLGSCNPPMLTGVKHRSHPKDSNGEHVERTLYIGESIIFNHSVDAAEPSTAA